jgi:hypothetical protein
MSSESPPCGLTSPLDLALPVPSFSFSRAFPFFLEYYEIEVMSDEYNQDRLITYFYFMLTLVLFVDIKSVEDVLLDWSWIAVLAIMNDLKSKIMFWCCLYCYQLERMKV